MEQAKSNYWVDQIAERIMREHPTGQIVVESGHAPSGYYHIGTLREILTASAIAWRLKQAGREAKHIDFVDDLDAFRKVPAGVPEEWAKYIGVPLRLVPDPNGKYASWAEWLTTELYEALTELGLDAEVRYASEEYPKGEFTPYIEAALTQMDKGREIISTLTKRELTDAWSPVQILSDSNNLREWHFTGFDKARKIVTWRDKDGKTGEIPYDGGRVKLDWRFDWPARWALLGVNVEPFGRDHASSGGSYDTGVRIIREIYGQEPPEPVPYEFINRVGDTRKMSKSAGNVVTAVGALKIMPAEIIRYFILKSMPSRTLFFDDGVGLFNLVDEYAKVKEAVSQGQHPDLEEAYRIASAQTKEQTVSTVPFGHLVQCYQAARRDTDRTLDLLERSGYEKQVAEDRGTIVRELVFVRNWLDEFAPDNVKFEVQDKLPSVALNDEQRAVLAKLADTIESEADLSGQSMHDAIYAACEEVGLKPSEAFVAIYRVLLGQDRGPKAGWFLASLDTSWLVSRLREASKQ